MERMSTKTQTRPLLKVAEVAERLSISESTVRRLIETGELPAHRLGAGPQPPVRVDPAALEAWLDQRLASTPIATGEAASGVPSLRTRGLADGAA